MAGSVDEEALHQLYLWIDNIPLSRPKRNLSRDFSDGGVRLCMSTFLSCMHVCKGSLCKHIFTLVYVCGVHVWGVVYHRGLQLQK